MIRLIGPGGAGKTTVGALLARRLGTPFVDLDRHFAATVEDISAFIDANGYECYAGRNIDAYADLLAGGGVQKSVLALSSGFMTYPEIIHPGYARLRQAIARDPMTFILLPSLDCETCVAETVRRQLRRPFSRSAWREEEVIRARFAVYRSSPTAIVDTMRPVVDVVDDLLKIILGRE